MKDPKNESSNAPFSSLDDQKKSKRIYLVIGLLVVIIAVLAIFLFKGRSKEDAALSPQMRQMKETVAQISKLETDIQDKQKEVFNLIDEYKTKTGSDITDFNIMNLTPAQKQVLQDKIKNEKDISIKSLLQDILDRNNEIKGLNEKVSELENLLPKPIVVEQGSNHYQIAMNFLMNEKGLDKKKAIQLVERTALFEPLVPGFKVWNFYSDNEYGTFVTQGTAPISPNQIQRKVKKELVDARDKAIAERDQLASNIEELSKKREEIIGQLDILNEEKTNMLARLNELSIQNEDLQTKINSLFYIVDTRSNLHEEGILKSSFLRSTKMLPVTIEQFTKSIDLRKDNTIKITAADLQLAKIKTISLFPKFYREDADYSIAYSEDKQSAVITLLSDKKLRGERIVLSVN